MSCPARDEIDLAHYLLDPTASEFAAFRAHYPGCEECAAEVAVWTSLETTLSEPAARHDSPQYEEQDGPDSGPWHPDVEALARYAGSPEATGAEQLKMERHLEACGTCRTEWQALQTFDFAEVVGVPWAADTASDAPQGLGARIAGWLGFDRSPRWATAGALAIVIGVTATWLALEPETRFGEERVAALEIAATRSASSQPNSSPTPVAPAAPPQLAHDSAGGLAQPVPTPAPMPETGLTPPAAATPTGDVQLAQSGLGSPSGGALPAVQRDDDEGRREDGTDNSLAVGDEILLASLSEMPPPDYAAPMGSSELAWMHQFGSVRGNRGSSAPARVAAHAPDHMGLTHSASPRLWWSVSEASEKDVTITVVDDREIDPLLEVVLAGPQKAGLASISLADHGVELEPGIEYRWYVTLVNDPDRPSRNLVSAGSIKRQPLDAEALAALENLPASQRGHELARRGYWYDSYDFFAALEVRHPEATALAPHRARLLAVATPTQ